MHAIKKTRFSLFRIKIVQWIIVFFAVYTLAGFLVVPPIIKLVLSKKLSEQLHREVTIKGATFNPYALSIHMNGIAIKDRDKSETLFSLDELYVNLQITSVFKMGLILKEVKVFGPYINIVRYKDTLYNFSDLLEKDKAKPSPETEPLRFSLNNIQISNGSIDFLDSPQNTHHKARDITLKIPVISNFSYFVDTFIQPFFQATVNNTSILIEGKTKPFHDSLETSIDLDIKDINIPHYLAYVTVPTNFKVISGNIDGKCKVLFSEYKDKPSSIIIAGDLSLKDLQVVDSEDRPLINLPVYSLKKAEIYLTKREVKIEEAYSKDGKIFARRFEDGTVNLQPQLPKLAEKFEEAAEKKKVSPWIVLIKNLTYEDFTFSFEDRVPSNPVNLIAKDIKLRAENISTEKNSRGSLSYSFILNETGTVSAESSISINPVSADLKLDMQNIDIIPLQPYFTEKVNILVTSGKFMTEGNFMFAYSEAGEMNAAYKGKASLSQFTAVDKVKANHFLKWNSLYLKDLDFKYKPLSVTINEVSLADFYSRLIINSDGTLNLQGIVKDENAKLVSTPSDIVQAGRDTEQKSSSAAQININTVTLQAGTVNFSDRHIKPNYSANLREIGGRISGLSSEEGTFADVDLRGKLENYAPLEIMGTINPLGKDLFVDLKVDFNDMDLSPLTPYANKYIGHNIQKGKLSLDLKYLIEKKKLDSRNNVFLDQFTLGEKVESPDATKLPVKFAISLLKNSKGEISLDLPVTGNIDDPEFNIGKIIIKMFVNLLVKAASSPFKLLGALVDGGEELSYINFDYGISGISEAEKAKLDKMIKALSDRPALMIDIEGYVDTERDMEGLRQYTFDKKLKTQKLKEMVKKGQAVVPVDDIIIEPEEYEKYLEIAYKEEKFPKPRNILGFLKKLPPSEMEKLIYAYIDLNDNDLRLLASRRALNVQDYFLKSGQINSKRIFLIEPESLQPEEKEKLKNSRVDFRLK
jgi:uncharacterized protein involved in outer membrane biogenesis